MTQGRVVVVRNGGLWQEQAADLSTALRSGRDDKGESRCDLQRRLW
jgi:hypothetical protein